MRHPKINLPPGIGAEGVRMNAELVKNAEKHRGRRGGVFAFGRKGVLVVQNGASRASEQEKMGSSGKFVLFIASAGMTCGHGRDLIA
jgi:hypothetical protein